MHLTAPSHWSRSIVMGGRDASEQVDAIIGMRKQGKKVSLPFPFLSISNSPALQRKAAEIWAHGNFPPNNSLGAISKRPRRDKIRIGYFSADFYDHATSRLMVGLFEKHDRRHFEPIALSFGPDRPSEFRKRLTAAFDNFIDVRHRSDREIALLARNLGIDIAVDLNGFTSEARTGVFSFRVAPIQVNYLVYPSTMAASYIDYLIADPILVRERDQTHYSEKIVYLPNSYQVNDATRTIAKSNFTREDFGLPRNGFVFCCFNNNYKINPDVFDCWMRLLDQIDESVLWLIKDNSSAAYNLKREAELRGISPHRIVFAERMKLDEHLARHRLADLFLDTLPYNAHTTASDALWAGLPVLTRIGDTFAGRVAASLLTAIELPELITTTREAYERLAFELAANPDKLRKLREKLAKNRLTTPLFDTQLSTRNIEAAYAAMIDRYQTGLSPDHIRVPRQPTLFA
jgi:predicted O-linked N-acetylglucosamine transferase (SPINDLY family)